MKPLNTPKAKQQALANKPRLVALLLTLVLLAACSNSSNKHALTTTTIPATSSSTTNPIGPVPNIKITEITKLDSPTAMAQRSGDDTIYITERAGTVRALKDGVIAPDPVIYLKDEVRTDGECGMLGITFAPKSNLFYVYFNDKNRTSHIAEFQLGNDNKVDMHTRREVLSIAQPDFGNHKGGQLAFGPDEMLYIGVGDGGGAGDPAKNGQNLTTLLGKILRINPKQANNLTYTIPYDNPIDSSSSARREIWAYGLRNPWRFSFSNIDKTLWIADVGQDAWEEIDRLEPHLRAPANLGWSLREGSHKYDGEASKDAISPLYEYGHIAGRCSITGGYVYSGDDISQLRARYIYGDFCTGELFALTQRGTTWSSDALNARVKSLSSFGQDSRGELYVLSTEGIVGRIDAA